MSAKHFKNFSRKYAMHLIEMDEIKNHHIYALYVLRYKFSYPVTCHDSFEQTALHFCSSV